VQRLSGIAVVFALLLPVAFLGVVGCDSSDDSSTTDTGIVLSPSSATFSATIETNIAFSVTGGTTPYIWSVSDTDLGTLVAAEATAIYTSKKTAGVNTVIVTDAVTNSAAATITQE
jgi:hypothetical protein